jgi:hypothetical protein
MKFFGENCDFLLIWTKNSLKHTKARSSFWYLIAGIKKKQKSKKKICKTV